MGNPIQLNATITIVQNKRSINLMVYEACLVQHQLLDTIAHLFDLLCADVLAVVKRHCAPEDGCLSRCQIAQLRILVHEREKFWVLYCAAWFLVKQLLAKVYRMFGNCVLEFEQTRMLLVKRTLRLDAEVLHKPVQIAGVWVEKQKIAIFQKKFQSDGFFHAVDVLENGTLKRKLVMRKM